MKSYKVKNLEEKLKKHKNIAASMKRSIDNHTGADWSKKNLITRYNKEIGVIKVIQNALVTEISKG